MGLQKVRVTGDTVELSPGSAPRMAIGADIALPDPTIIEAHGLGTILGMGVDRPRTPALARDQRRRRRRGPGAGLLGLLPRLGGGGVWAVRPKVCGLSPRFWSAEPAGASSPGLAATANMRTLPTRAARLAEA